MNRWLEWCQGNRYDSYKILFHPSQQKFVIRKTTSSLSFSTKQTQKLEVSQASLRCLAGISIKIALPDHSGMMRYSNPLFG